MEKAFASVKAMHQKFGIAYDGPPRQLTIEEKSFRLVALNEELFEFEEATTLNDQLDALADLIVFAIGTAERMGLPLAAAFDRVMAANMQKELASATKVTKRGFQLDLFKPAGWVAPDHSDLVGEK